MVTTLCMSCKHINLEPNDEYEYTCEAFPLAIPPDICFDDFDHRNPHPDDNGIHYERNPILPEDEFPTKEVFDKIFERARREREKYDDE